MKPPPPNDPYDDPYDHPFDDPQLKVAMAEAGVVHDPGLAVQMLEELAPLLADEGFDIKNLGDDIDYDAFGAAFQRATDRYNMELFTPVREQRARALAVLRQFCEALWSDDEDLTDAIMAAIEPEPTESLPAVSHVIGVAIGLVDTWHTDPAYRAALTGVRIPSWDEPSRMAARDIVTWGREGIAFDSLGTLVVAHPGRSLLDGAALAVAACLRAIAESKDDLPASVAAALLAENVRQTAPAADAQWNRPRVDKRQTKKNRHVSGNPAKRGLTASDRALAKDFAGWLRAKPGALDDVVADEINMFERFIVLSRQAGLDLDRPFGVERVIDGVLRSRQDGEDDEDDEDNLDDAVVVLMYDYAEFRLDSTGPGAGWEEALDTVGLALDAGDPLRDLLSQGVETSNQISQPDRLAACLSSPVVSMVPQLLQWVGSGRKITSTAGLRRADIAEVAGLLGMKAVGVGKRPPYEPDGDDETPDGDDETIHAQSMWEIPALAAWWHTLRTTQIIKTSTTLVRVGPEGQQWLADGGPSVELADMLIGIFVAEFVSWELHDPYAWVGDRVFALSVAHLALGVGNSNAEVPVGEQFVDQYAAVRVDRQMRELARLGIVEVDDAGRTTVPPALRGAIARGLRLARVMAEVEEA